MTRRAGGDEEEEKSPDLLCFLVGLGKMHGPLAEEHNRQGSLRRRGTEPERAGTVSASYRCHGPSPSPAAAPLCGDGEYSLH